MERNRNLLLVAAMFISACSGESAQFNVPAAQTNASPAPALAAWSRAAMNAVMRLEVWRGANSGYIAMFARDGVPVYANAAGFKDIAGKQPMTLDTHIRIASMTKPITAVVAMQLIEQGRLGLDDAVSDYLPEFAHPMVATSHSPDSDGKFPAVPARTQLRIRHLLMFAAGIGPGREEGSALVDYWDAKGIYEQPAGTLAERVTALAKLPLLEEPGTRWRYGFSADVLARVVEVISGQSIAAVMQENIFDPLGMSHTRYLPTPGERADLATVYTQDASGDLIKAPLPYDTEWTPGGGGLVSTVSDYMRFALMLWNGGTYQDARILQVDTVKSMRQLHVPDGVLAAEGIEGLGWGLGMAVVADADASLTPDRNGDFWWAGYYGTTFFISPETGLVGVIMTQNEPSEHSGLPLGVYVIQALAYAGL